ncbi:MAG TPA: sulfite exporter TauE/SafE family protein [Verrucomicrobiae bacterium]|nr:sulfite exporter TauE/SafE family protein [Verrucomicrobiae bacterium]
MDLLLVVTFVVALFSSVISGMSGGGGGFIMTPYYLLIGFTPQQIAAGASVASLGLGGSSLMAIRGQQLLHKQFLWPLLAITVPVTLLAMMALPKVHSDAFELVIGVLLIVLAPTLFINKKTLQPGTRSRKSVIAGYCSYAIILFASSLGTGLATLLFLPLMFLMGLTALQANATRRVLLLVQALLVFATVLPQGYIVWSHASVALIGNYLGGYIGTKFAIRRGEKFVKLALASVMLISGGVLVF